MPFLAFPCARCGAHLHALLVDQSAYLCPCGATYTLTTREVNVDDNVRRVGILMSLLPTPRESEAELQMLPTCTVCHSPLNTSNVPLVALFFDEIDTGGAVVRAFYHDCPNCHARVRRPDVAGELIAPHWYRA